MTTSYEFDPVERVRSITHSTGPGNVLKVASGATYNARGQLHFINRGGNPSTSEPSADGLASTYSYEGWSGRLLSADTFAGVLPVPEPNPLNTELVHLYRGLLLRDESDTNSGYLTWVDELANGATIETIAGEFIANQPEWLNAEAAKPSLNPDTTTTFDVRTNTGFVDWLVDSILLGEMPAGATKALWKADLDALKNPLDGDVYPNLPYAKGAFAHDAMESALGKQNELIHYPNPEPPDPDTDADVSKIRTLDYVWDQVGNLDRVYESDDETLSQYQCFSYDVLDRLKTGFTTGGADCGGYDDSVGPTPFSVGYDYDPIGNITSAAGTGTVGTVNAAGLLVAADYVYSDEQPHAVIAAGDNSYGYDKAGNQTSRQTGLGAQTLTYDVQNRLVGITGAGADMAALYDAGGNRVYRSLDGDETVYLGGAYQIRDGVLQTSFSVGGQTVGHVIDGTFTAASSDHLGSGAVTLTANELPVVQRYTPFGQIRGASVTNSLPVDETFTGQTDDPNTGLIDYNARHYDPELGRFIMSDPVLDGFNRYRYVANNPLRYTDPTGLCSCSVGEFRGSGGKTAATKDDGGGSSTVAQWASYLLSGVDEGLREGITRLVNPQNTSSARPYPLPYRIQPRYRNSVPPAIKNNPFRAQQNVQRVGVLISALLTAPEVIGVLRTDQSGLAKIGGVADAAGGTAAAILGATLLAPIGAVAGPGGAFAAGTYGAAKGEQSFDYFTDLIRDNFPTGIDVVRDQFPRGLEEVTNGNAFDSFQNGVDMISSGEAADDFKRGVGMMCQAFFGCD